MIRSLPVRDIKIGMYVTIPKNWFLHPFLRNSFHINSEKDLAEIRKLGVRKIPVDTDKSKVLTEIQVKTPSPKTYETKETKKLDLIINNRTLTPKKKSKAVYKQSAIICNKVLTNPSPKIIKESKYAIAKVTDLILHNEDVSENLLRITAHDSSTYNHSVNVGILSIYLCKRLYMNNKNHNLHELGAAFFLHDLGKITIESDILNKPGRLTPNEMKRIRTHPFQSYKILKENENITEETRIICMQHHEREDGTGYPKRLSKGEIHDYSKICTIADVFDALTSPRPYKKSFSTFKALTIMKNEMLGFFQKEIFENFVLLFAPDNYKKR